MAYLLTATVSLKGAPSIVVTRESTASQAVALEKDIQLFCNDITAGTDEKFIILANGRPAENILSMCPVRTNESPK